MEKFNFSANYLKSHLVIVSTLFSYSASCNKDKPAPSPPKKPDNSISKEEEERILREKEAEEKNNLIRDLSINKVRVDLHGDDNSIKNGELIASVLVDANVFFKKNFSKFVPVYEKGLEKLKKEGLIFTYANDAFKDFFIASLKEKKLDEDLVVRIVEQVIELLRIQYISDSVKRKEEVRNYSDKIDREKGDKVNGTTEILLKEFQKALK